MNAFMTLLPVHDARGAAVMELDAAFQQHAAYAHAARDWEGWRGGLNGLAAPPATPAAARPPAPTSRYPTLCHALLHRMDAMVAMYDRQRKDDLAEVVRCRILSFLTQPAHVAVLGNRESQTVARFFERLTNGFKMSRSTPKEIAALEKFLGFWVDAKVRVCASDDDAELGPGTLRYTWARGGWHVERGI